MFLGLTKFCEIKAKFQTSMQMGSVPKYMENLKALFAVDNALRNEKQYQ
jgi:hypothetical protein